MSTYLPALDGLRAFSVIAVVAFHCGLIDGGWIGVDVFFGISGFLITGLLVAEFDRSGHIRLSSFWARRVRRLIPALILLLLLVCVLVACDQIDLPRRSAIGAVTYSSNWLNIAGGHSYWDAFATPDPLRHLWSLAIEEQIYLIWPILAWWALRRGGRSRLQILGFVGAGLSTALQFAGPTWHWSVDRLYQGTDTRAVPFLLGAALAARRWPPREHPSSSPFVMTMSICVLVVAAVALPGHELWIFSGPLIAVSVAGCALIAGSAASTARVVTWRPLRRLGRWSYGIYLFHWPLAISSGLASLDDRLRFVLVLALSTGLAAVTFRWIESPIRTRRWSTSLVVAGTVTACVVTGIAVSLAQPSSPELDTSVTLPTASATSSLGHRVMIFGDSVPALAADELADVARDQKIALEVRAEPGCSPSEQVNDQYGKPECVDFLLGTRTRATAIGIDTAVLWWGGTMENFYENGTDYRFCDPSARPVAAARLQRLLDYFAGVSTRVLVLPIPRLDIPARHAIGTACEIEIYRQVARANHVELIDLAPSVCPSFPADCTRIERFDGLHFDHEAATRVATIIFDWLETKWTGGGA